MSGYCVFGTSALVEDPEMSETLTMSTKERQRLQILGHLQHGKTTVVKAAAALGISERQMYRVLDRYRCQIIPGFHIIGAARISGSARNRPVLPSVHCQSQEVLPAGDRNMLRSTEQRRRF